MCDFFSRLGLVGQVLLLTYSYSYPVIAVPPLPMLLRVLSRCCCHPQKQQQTMTWILQLSSDLKRIPGAGEAS